MTCSLSKCLHLLILVQKVLVETTLCVVSLPADRIQNCAHMIQGKDTGFLEELPVTYRDLLFPLTFQAPRRFCVDPRGPLLCGLRTR